MDEETLKSAVWASIAKTILEGLDTEARDALLEKSIQKSIKDYAFSGEVSKVVADKARRVVLELVETEDWERRITEAIRSGFNTYISNLERAIPNVISLSMHGELGDSYSKRSAAILKCWKS